MAANSSQSVNPEYDLLKKRWKEISRVRDRKDGALRKDLKKEMVSLQKQCKFQADNVKNQLNHVLHLLINMLCVDERLSSSDAISLLADKTLKNYVLWYNYSKKWLDRDDAKEDNDTRDDVKVGPHLDDEKDKLTSLCLYYLIWGEAANLRFMPECLCFIYHKMRASVRGKIMAKETFLVGVITPVYKILEYEKNRYPGHFISHGKVANYDDINELFWSSQCLKLFKWDHLNLGWDVNREPKGMLSKWESHIVKEKRKVNFVEHRSFFHIYHSFHRLWIFFAIMLQVLAIIAFTGGFGLKYALLVGPTHAFLMFLQSVLNIVFTYGAYVKHTTRIASQFVFYAVATAILIFLAIKRFQEDLIETSVDYISIYKYVASFYLAAHLLHAVGYTLLSIVPIKNDKVGRLLKGIFKERYFIGNGMQVRAFDLFKYATFWIVLLSTKFFVSYKTQIQPLVRPTQTIVTLNDIHYAWHDFISKNHYNILTVISLWAPIYFLDTQIWYVVFSAVLGCISGGMARLGETRSMYMFAKNFRKMPKNFEQRLIMSKGDSFHRYWNELIGRLREEDYLNNEEKELLVMESKTQWPLFILVNEVQRAISLCKENRQSELLREFRKDGYLRDAVREIFRIVADIFGKLELWNGDEGTKSIAAFDKCEGGKRKKYKQIEALLKIQIPITNSMVQSLVEVFLEKNYKATWDDKTLNEKLITLGIPVKRLETLLNENINVGDVPRNSEARRRLIFFGNSLLMKMPEAPPVEQMLSFSVLTPHYKEEVLYSIEDLLRKNKDGITTLYYLQLVYSDEWKNFIERKAHKWKNESEKDNDIRLWASYRGQTLARTVRGMMYYSDALEFQALGSLLQDGCSSSAQQKFTKEQQKFAANLAQQKFTYVVTSQDYAKFRKTNDSKAKDLEILMKKYPYLRVAYIHQEGNVYTSKLAMVVNEGEDPVTVYSIELPGNFLIGEGKPENQNHALIFTRGEALQTIDMNQDNSFEEALKMRNLLEELKKESPPTILGVREHIFTGSVSSLAWFMSNQETTFVTLSQRVMASPLKIRMHYGHPDVFDRIFHITRGGISKASKTINLSEDVFAGYNSTLRGGRVTHHEYIQVGKGRDLGLNQISSFEAKVSSGNGEQILSRDVYRLARFFDFWRMLSFYYTSVGFYISTAMIVVALYAYLYGKVYMALSGVEKDMLTRARIESNHQLEAALTTQAIFQFGFLNCAPMVMGYVLEQGFLKALAYFILMWLLGSFIFFAFSLGTRTHYFGRTILHGGAKYRSTGRGFVIEHVQFAENYRFYSRSHFVKGFEIAMLLVVYVIYGAQRSRTGTALLVVDVGFLAFCWIYAPFFFNPLCFEWQKTVEDISNWNRWIANKSHSAQDTEGWGKWWDEQTDLRGARSKIAEAILSLRFFLIQFGVAYHLREGVGTNSLLVYASSWVLFVCIGLLIAFLSLSPRSGNKLRFFHFIISIGLLAAFITGCVFVLRQVLDVLDVLASILALIPTGWGLLSLGITCKPLIRKSGLWWLVTTWAWSYDVGMGYVVFAPIIFLSWFPFISPLHTRILFNQAFSRGLEISVLLSTPLTPDNQRGVDTAAKPEDAKAVSTDNQKGVATATKPEDAKAGT